MYQISIYAYMHTQIHTYDRWGLIPGGNCFPVFAVPLSDILEYEAPAKPLSLGKKKNRRKRGIKMWGISRVLAQRDEGRGKGFFHSDAPSDDL
jgi:hypothetical protein